MIIDWQQIDTVLLDMDGTLLDLHYDNYYWVEHLPKLYADKHGMSVDLAKQKIKPILAAKFGQLEWYCTDYWSNEFDIDIAKTKAAYDVAQKISFRPHAEKFLEFLNQQGKQVWMVTNAHRDVLDIKCERLELVPYFEHLISSHDFGFSKEHLHFWQALKHAFPFDPERSLFVDDSVPILRTAQDFGIKHLRAISHPDSQKPEKNTEEFMDLPMQQVFLSKA